MRMLLRWFTLLLCLALAFPAALGESDTEALTALGYQLAQGEIDALLEDATGWSRVMLEDIQLGEVTVSKSSVTVYLTVPSLKSCLRSSVTLEDYAPKDYLAQAMADYLGHETREELKLNFTYKIKDGEITTQWSGVSNPRKLENSLASLSGTAKKSYNNKNTRAAIAAYLLPQAAQMPSREPDEMPAMASLGEYAAQVGPALGLTAQQAEGRLRCLMMMMDLTAMDTTEPLEATVLTLKVDDWATMLANAETLAQEAMAAAVGVPEMSEAELEAFLWDALPQAMLPLLYDRKGTTEVTLTVDLPAALQQGPQSATALMDYFAAYSAEVDAAMARLAAYAATLPYYPRVAQIPSGVLEGQEEAGGTPVTFDLGSDTENSGYVRVYRDGALVLGGFIRQGVRLTVKLAPGDYTVYYTTGPEWFGSTHLMGRDAVFGSFPLTVPGEDHLTVHMEEGEGDVPVTPLTQEEFNQGPAA